ncbi:MAG: MFS transporter [Bacteriovoracaceae bacterium]|nr:MFS transporter [Bacteriovoracaceae bacterium]
MWLYYLDSLFYSLMIGAGESYFPAYSLRLGHTPLQASLVATVPVCLGGLFQIIVPKLMYRFTSLRTWCVLGAFLQAMCFVSLIYFHPHLAKHHEFLILIVTFYWIFNLAVSPGWSTLIAEQIPTEKINHFFNLRGMFGHIGVVIGLVYAGFAIQYDWKPGFVPEIFLTIFLVSALARLVSTYLLSLYKDSHKHQTQAAKQQSSLDLKQFEDYPNLKRTTFYFSLFKLSVYVSAGYFSPYMLDELRFTYTEFMLVLASAYIGRIIFSNFYNQFRTKLTVNSILFFSSLGISCIPFIWTQLHTFKHIFMLEIFTGIFWGAFELSFFLIIFNRVPSTLQRYYMSYYNFYHYLGIGIGTAIGLILFRYVQIDYSVYFLVFSASSAFRLLSMIFFPRLKAHMPAQKVNPSFFRTLGIRPDSVENRPIFSVIEKMRKEIRNKIKIKPSVEKD